MKALNKVMFVINTESLRIVFAHKHAKNPITIPNSGPPNDTLTKLTNTPAAVAVYPLIKFMKTMKKTIAVPSFSKD